MPNEIITTGEKITLLAKRQGVSIPELARRVDMSQPGLSYQLRKETWKLPLLEKIAGVLGVEVKELI